MESAEPLPEVRPLEEPPDESEDEDEDEDEVEPVEEESVAEDVDDESVPLPAVSPEPERFEPLVPLELLDPVPVLAVVSASACIVPTRANTPAAAASVTAAATAAVRCAPLRTAAAAPRSLEAMTVPLRSDAVSRPTVGERPERSL
ncbi:hypothetical protein ACIO93_22685 [Streptomyces sp. NPDC087903]|uniref:hypothetical protein n=1 Tax=Streptomyces sp. NPDC087903 TaxID=3365819 RepID=UPI00381513FB